MIEEITENNYVEKRVDGEQRVEEKIKFLKIQERKAELKEPVNWNIFFDPTIWAYKYLKDKQGNPLRLRGYQDRIINDKHRLIITAAANQIGKTWSMCVKAIHHTLHVNSASVIIVSKSEQQAIMILDEIKWMLRRANIKFDPIVDAVENRTELHLKSPDGQGVSVIRCIPPTTRVLAYPATLIICDEIGFWEIEKMDSSDYFERVIMSRTLATMNWENDKFTMGQICCISNPNAQQGVMWKLWRDSNWHQYRYCIMANPDITDEFYESVKPPNKTQDVFDSVYAAVFSSAAGGFITGDEYEAATKEDYDLIPPLTMPLYFGGDFAGEDTRSRDVDETVLFGAIKIRVDNIDKCKIVYYREFPKRVKKTVVYDELNRFDNIAMFSYDKVGVGDSVKNDLIDRNVLAEYQIEPLTYSLPNKSDVYYNLKHLFEQRKIILSKRIPAKLKEQLLGLRFERTQAGHMSQPQIKVHHTEGLHDDWADALANCCWACMRGSAIPVDLTIVEPVPVKRKKSGKDLIFCKDCDDYHYGGCDEQEES